MNKSELRKAVKAVRSNISDDELLRVSGIIAENFLKSDLYLNSKTVFCYKSKKSEICTDKIISKALKDGKRVCLPKCSGTDMTFYEISKGSRLVMGKFGIEEPDNACKPVSSFEASVCVIPCLCCDTYGHRLGYGGGFYDRFLEHFTGIKAVLCPKRLIFNKIPFDDYDIAADYIISE